MADFHIRTLQPRVGPTTFGTVHRRAVAAGAEYLLTEDGQPLLTEAAANITIEAA